MNKHLKAFSAIITVSPLLFLGGLVTSIFLYTKVPVPIFSHQQLITIFTGVGALLIVIGTILAFIAQTRSRIVAHPSFKATAESLMGGVYKYSRHPGSLSLIIMYIGFALVANSLMMILVAIILIILLTFIFIPIQEKSIAELCPEAYAEYKTKVRMWL